MKTSLTLLAVGALAGGLWSSASAQQITTTFVSSNPASDVTGTFQGPGNSAVQRSGILNFEDVDFHAFCVEPLGSIAPGDTVTFDITSLTQLTNSDAVGRIITAFLGGAQTNSTAAGAQWAIWEVVAETANSYDISSGDIAITGTGANAVAATSAANNFLTAAFDTNVAVSQLTYLTNPTKQNQVTWVPEPSSALLLGVSAIGMLARRRR